ncbi:MAG: serine protease [Deltaproteobacteria bacterium]|nr:serine protease [Deltaproteobacteria bacterium]
MVLKNVFSISGLFFALFILVLSGCERIPEWERQSGIVKNSDESTRLSETRKWIWTCRGVIPNYNADKNQKFPGRMIEGFLDYFHDKGLSSLDLSTSKTLIGTALLWSDTGVLISSRPWFENVQDLECSNGNSPWLDATVKGIDRALDIIALQVSLPAQLHFSRDNRWLMRSDAVTLGEKLSVISAAYPGQIDRLNVTVEPFRTQLHTGMDEELILFLPPPSEVSMGGILMDEKWRAVGFLLSHPVPLWGAAISMKRLEETVHSILDHGKVNRPYTGLRLKPGVAGFSVQQIDVGSPAYQAGLRVKDLLIKWDGKDLKIISDWQELSADDLHRSIALTYKRGDKMVETQLTPTTAQ